MNVLISIFEQIILFLPLTFGVFISYVVLQTTDITADGSFVFGACVFASMINFSVNPVVSTLVAVILGSSIGVFVGVVSRNNTITPLIASILVLFMLQSINLQVMGRPNIGIPQKKTLFALLPDFFMSRASLIVLMLFLLFITCALYIFLKTRFGLYLRACGINQKLFLQLGKSGEFYRCFGLALSNGLAALCGVLTAQLNGFADISMGFGVALIGISTVTFGGQILKAILNLQTFNPLTELASCILGTAIYFFAVNLLLIVGIDPMNLKLFLGLGLIIFLKAAKNKVGGNHG